MVARILFPLDFSQFFVLDYFDQFHLQTVFPDTPKKKYQIKLIITAIFTEEIRK